MDKKSIICLVASVIAFVLGSVALGVPVLTSNGASVSIGDKLDGSQDMVSLLNALWAFNILLLIGLVIAWGLHFYSKTACQVMGLVNFVLALITLSLAAAVIAKINNTGLAVGPSAPLILVASLIVIVKQLMTNSLITSMF